ncbi:hypothetical protein N431DRAFT_519382 [Stipitochalara longipes BDJ]|nr:hypothetical protein N431DRAFT_519382 [Stipitochalara longipes BDJ]
MEPLNITSSIAGIITAASQVSDLLGQIKDAPKSITAVAAELDHIQLIFRALQKFLDSNTRVSGERATLIQLEDVVVILTQTVLVFSELESLISPIANGNKTTYLVRLTWIRL